MARKKRIHIPGRYYHVMLRGNDGQDIFFNDSDRSRFCLLLQEGVERYGHIIHSFCFMSNHVHFLIQVGDISLSKVMQNVSFRYTRYINKTYSRIGHLFQGRFKSILLAEEGYFTRLIRYIHLNPVRAGLVKKPEEYMWGSHRCFLGMNCITWVKIDIGLQQFSHKIVDARKAFQAYVLKGIDEDPEDIFERENLIAAIPTEKEILEYVQLKVREVKEAPRISFAKILESVCRELGVSKVEITSPSKVMKVSQARAMLTLLAQEFSDMNLKEIATKLKRDPSTLSGLLRRHSQKENNKFKSYLKRIKDKLVADEKIP